ncbi:MAG: ATP-binding protein [Peptoniphilus sp.]|uniref:ATP-binding protein n=1 Tax=Peptoniphilus sp. TaxID=1971214 RepID=UPI0025D6C68F|nr:ATP-binding protein [Peptoniphilus sp.]MCI5642655.1 ATP-binding protein [Peptoniphilus sp.]MDD7352741.1 ATP-binding protein [Peptoniphilaceae bacterium]MDY3903345.1 ATP-binding protein [Peptoniphilus sp.]
MKVLGVTTTREVYIGSKEKNFRNNEFLIVEDPVQGDIIGEVVDSKTFNRFIPLDIGGDFVDNDVLSSLDSMGYDVGEETVYIAKLRFFEELLYPPLTGSDLRAPEFYEIKNLLIDTMPNNSLVLGSIKNTDNIAKGMDDVYKNLFSTFENNEYLKQRELPYLFDYKSMHQYPHIGVFGGSGSGKSFGLRVILEELMEMGVPAIVMDPHYEMDFSNNSEISNKNYSDKFRCLEIGLQTGIKFQELQKRDLKNLLNAASPLTDSMKNVIDIMLAKGSSFESFKNKLDMLLEGQEIGSRDKILSEIAAEPDITRMNRLEEVLDIYERYDKTCNSMSVRGVLWRLINLQNEGIFSHNIDELLDLLKRRKLVVLQGSTRMINVFSTYLLAKLYYLRKEYRDELYRRNVKVDYFPPFVIITDEAHNFAPKGFDTPSKNILREISQEGRKYGVFLILATQRPTLLDETITAQLNTKLIFRTVRASDIDTIKEETDLSVDETKRLPYLSSGDVFISSAKKGRTSFVRIRAANTVSPHTENPFDELVDHEKENFEKFFIDIKDLLPIDATSLNIALVNYNKKSGENLSYDEFKNKLDELCERDFIEKEDNFLTEMYKIK